MQYGNCDTGIVTDATHPAVTRIERRVGPSTGREREVGTVVRANAFTQGPVARRASGPLDPPVLIRWDRLVGQLPTDPRSLLSEYHVPAEPRRRECGGDGTQAATDDGDIGPEHLHVASTTRGLIAFTQSLPEPVRPTMGYSRGAMRREAWRRRDGQAVKPPSEAMTAPL